MVGVGAVTVATRSNARQDWLAVKDWHSKGCLVKLALPRYALLRAVLDDQGSVHPAGLALEVFPLTLMGVDLPGSTTSATQCHIVIHAIILALNNSGMVTLELEPRFVYSAMSVFCDIQNHLGLLPILVTLKLFSVQQDNHIGILLNAT
jgi:hypothetical protein